ncbi:MAG: hypothetical protein HKN01_12235 [Acidimicrobiia bacterium]|nr:hypothetical protein [Acidimicrobiia bacterium]
MTSIGYVCTVSGTIADPVPDPDPPERPPVELPPVRYLVVGSDVSVGDCWFWSRYDQPGAIDSWDAANDALILDALFLYPACPGTPVAPAPAPVEADVRAWEVFRSFELALPLPVFEPPMTGISGLPTYVSLDAPADITHSEVLPDGRILQVQAAATARIEWGDGAVTTHDPATMRPFPSGTATHTYLTKTCPAEYREEHPRGHLCHPTLEAYPVTVAFRWSGRYDVGEGWVSLGDVDRVTATVYDVDEVIGVTIEP